VSLGLHAGSGRGRGRTRSLRGQLGFPGVMLNGYQNVGDAATGWYYDHDLCNSE